MKNESAKLTLNEKLTISISLIAITISIVSLYVQYFNHKMEVRFIHIDSGTYIDNKNHVVAYINSALVNTGDRDISILRLDMHPYFLAVNSQERTVPNIIEFLSNTQKKELKSGESTKIELRIVFDRVEIKNYFKKTYNRKFPPELTFNGSFNAKFLASDGALFEGLILEFYRLDFKDNLEVEMKILEEKSVFPPDNSSKIENFLKKTKREKGSINYLSTPFE